MSDETATQVNAKQTQAIFHRERMLRLVTALRAYDVDPKNVIYIIPLSELPAFKRVMGIPDDFSLTNMQCFGIRVHVFNDIV